MSNQQQPASEHDEFDRFPTKNSWRALQIFNIYRICLALSLLTGFTFGLDIFPLGRENGSLFFKTAEIYLLIVIVNILCAALKKPRFNWQVIGQVMIDIIILTLLMHTSYGAIGLLGILINAAIAGGSILTEGQTSILFAAVASIAVLLEHAYSLTIGLHTNVNYTQIGFVGLTFFVTAILGYTLSRRIRQTEALAHKRSAALAHVSMLNDYIVQQIRSAILVVNMTGQIELINHSAQQLLQLNREPINENLSVVAPVLAQQLTAWRENPHLPIPPFRIAEYLSEVIPQFIALGDAPKTYTVIFLDDMALIAQQAQQLKLASLGRLAASIAHEIRNPLGAVSHAGQLLAESTVLTGQDQRLLEIIHQQTERMNEVVNNVLQLSRRSQAKITPLAFKPWLLDLIENDLLTNNPQAIINYHIEPADLIIHFDATQLKQILINLCENGLRYSQQEIGEAKILIEAYANNSHEDTHIDIIDYGPGIAPEIMTQVFEPFFTTEKLGTGLGLYMSEELCEANKAHLDYIDKEEAGACFRIRLAQAL